MNSDIQLSNFGDAPDQLYLQRGALDVTKSAVSFRDISAADEKKEMAIKIAMVVGAIILLIVTIVAVSEIAKLSPIAIWVHNRWGQIFLIYEYPALAAIVPGILGTAGVIGLAAGAAVIDLERERNGWSKDLSGEGAVEKELFILTSENLEDIYKNYYRRDGGMQPLVRNGLISEDEGRQLSGLLEGYHVQATKKAAFESHGKTFKDDLAKYPKKYPAYDAALTEIAKYQDQWKKLQRAIQGNYSEE